MTRQISTLKEKKPSCSHLHVSRLIYKTSEAFCINFVYRHFYSTKSILATSKKSTDHLCPAKGTHHASTYMMRYRQVHLLEYFNFSRIYDSEMVQILKFLCF